MDLCFGVRACLEHGPLGDQLWSAATSAKNYALHAVPNRINLEPAMTTEAERLGEQIKAAMRASLMSNKVEAKQVANVDLLVALAQQAQEAQEPVAWLYKGIAPHTNGKLHASEARAKNLETRWWVELGPICLCANPKENQT